jgi:hypothetical protein
MSAYSRYPGPSDYSEVLTDDSRKCEVEGCHRKHAFCRPDGIRKVYSRYCNERTFSLWLVAIQGSPANSLPDTCGVQLSEAEGTHCRTPRQPTDRFCSVHMTCGEPGCAKLGEFVGGYNDYIPWFCRKRTSPSHPPSLHHD